MDAGGLDAVVPADVAEDSEPLGLPVAGPLADAHPGVTAHGAGAAVGGAGAAVGGSAGALPEASVLAGRQQPATRRLRPDPNTVKVKVKVVRIRCRGVARKRLCSKDQLQRSL